VSLPYPGVTVAAVAAAAAAAAAAGVARAAALRSRLRKFMHFSISAEPPALTSRERISLLYHLAETPPVGGYFCMLRAPAAPCCVSYD
jgi:hypothetical protein